MKLFKINLGFATILGMDDRKETISEQFLIENRSKTTLKPEDLVCPFHRNYFGRHFPLSQTGCYYPEHESLAKIKKCATYKLSYQLWRKVSQKFDIFLGASVCHKCLQKIKVKFDQESSTCEDEDDTLSYQSENLVEDDDYEQKAAAKTKLQKLLEVLELPELKYQCKKKDEWKNAKATTEKYGKWLFSSISEAVEKTISEGFFPNDPEGYLKGVQVLPESNKDISIEQITELFKIAKSSKSKMGLLTLICGKYSRVFLTKTLGNF